MAAGFQKALADSRAACITAKWQGLGGAPLHASTDEALPFKDLGVHGGQGLLETKGNAWLLIRRGRFVLAASQGAAVADPLWALRARHKGACP